MEKAAEMFRECKTRFFELWNDLPSWDPIIDPLAKKYVQGFADWVVGSHYWYFECKRYFGSAAEQVFETRTVTLLPKFSPMAVKC